MNRAKLNAAVAEAERFIKRAKAWDARAIEWKGTKEGGALRRASMDLTRALADLRRPS